MRSFDTGPFWVICSLFSSCSVSECTITCSPSCVSLSSLPSYSNSSTNTLDLILSRGYLKVGTTGDYKPYTYLLSNSTYIGADIDSANSLSQALGLTQPVKFVQTTWSNLTTDLAANKFDIAMSGISKTLQRARKFMYSAAIVESGKSACIRCSDAERFTDLASIDQPGVKVVVNPGGTNQAFDEANLKLASIVVLANNGAWPAAVLDGTGDVMITDVEEIELQSKLKEGKLCVVNDGKTFDFSEKAFLMGRDAIWKAFVDEWVNIFLRSGAWNETHTKWMDYEWDSV